jgi:hypothetical protein
MTTFAPSDILILTAYDEAAAPYGDIARYSWMEYATAHDHRFQSIQLRPPAGVHPAWEKLAVIKHAIADSCADFIFWTDADSVVTNHRRPLLFCISDDELPRIEIAASRDWSADGHWSAGHMLINCNSARVRAFIDASASPPMAARFANRALWDQSAMHHIERTRYIHAPSPVRILSRRTWNSVPSCVQPSAVDPWQQGDLLAHITGVGDIARRAQLMEQFDFAALR